MINGYGPYKYRVTYENGQHHWEYLGRVDGDDGGSSDTEQEVTNDDEQTDTSNNAQKRIIENPTDALEQDIEDNLDVDVNVVERDGYIVVETGGVENAKQIASDIQDGDGDIPISVDSLDESDTDVTRESVRKPEEDEADAFVFDRSEIYRDMLPTDGYSDDTGSVDRPDRVRFEDFNSAKHTSPDVPRVSVDIDYDHKDDLKEIYEADPHWTGDTWTIRADEIEHAAKELESEGLEVLKNAKIKSYLDSVEK